MTKATFARCTRFPPVCSRFANDDVVAIFAEQTSNSAVAALSAALEFAGGRVTAVPRPEGAAAIMHRLHELAERPGYGCSHCSPPCEFRPEAAWFSREIAPEADRSAAAGSGAESGDARRAPARRASSEANGPTVAGAAGRLGWKRGDASSLDFVARDRAAPAPPRRLVQLESEMGR